jgi:hypothetical protein
MATVPGSGNGLRSQTKVAIIAIVSALFFAAPPARAQERIERSETWRDVTTVLTLSSIGVQVLMPRVFYSDPEVTVGWKARWHLSVLAPSMTLVATGFLNEQLLKEAFKGHRPGCNEDNQGLAGCESYGMLSTHSYLAGAAFGQGLGLFLVDTIKWSDGRFNAGSFAMNVGVPGVLGVVTAVGRSAGDWETGGQSWGSAGIGAALGLGLGALYASLQRPECGYGGDLICW